MKIKVNGQELNLKKKDVDVAQKLVNSFIDSIRDNAVIHNKLQMYITTMVIMHNTSGDVLRNIDPVTMKALVANNKED